jgi:hypothetical protein
MFVQLGREEFSVWKPTKGKAARCAARPFQSEHRDFARGEGGPRRSWCSINAAGRSRFLLAFCPPALDAQRRNLLLVGFGAEFQGFAAEFFGCRCRHQAGSAITEAQNLQTRLYAGCIETPRPTPQGRDCSPAYGAGDRAKGERGSGPPQSCCRVKKWGDVLDPDQITAAPAQHAGLTSLVAHRQAQ